MLDTWSILVVLLYIFKYLHNYLSAKEKFGIFSVSNNFFTLITKPISNIR